MPIKFSSLTTKGIANTVKLVGLYNDNTSETGVSNCLVNVADFARKTELNNLDSSVVHISGNETISGTKTFYARDINLQSSDINIADPATASGSSYEHIAMFDVNKKEFAHFKSIFNNNTITTEIAANPDGDVNNFKSIGVSVNTTTGVTTTKCPPPTDTTSESSKQIATVGWANSTSVGNNIVHKSSAETITGIKTFTNTGISIKFKNNNLEQMTNPSAYSEQMVFGTDSNDIRIGSFGIGMTVEGYSRTYLAASKKINDTYKYCTINTYIDSSGNVWTSAPTPAAGDNSTKIATTQWVNNHTISGTGFFPNYSGSYGVSSGWTATANGWIRARCKDEGGSGRVLINGVIVMGCDRTWSGDYEGIWDYGMAPIAKGQKVTTSGDVDNLRFIPCL